MKACALLLVSSCIRPQLNLTRPPLLVSIRRNQVRPPLKMRPSSMKMLLTTREAKAPWMNSPCKLQAPRVSLKPSRVLAQTLMKCAPSPPQDVRPPSLPHKSQVKNESPKCLYPLFSLLMPTLKDQWPRLDLAKSNQWVRSTPIISLRKPTFLSCFMSINSPTL
jgi:hypothetical protein